MTANVKAFAVGQLVADLAAMFRLRASSKGLRFDVVEPPVVDRTVAGDQGKIRQVLIDLVGNAIKFTDTGHVKLEVTVSRRPGGQLWLSARVEDTGVGIAASEQGQLFQPFTQTQSGIRLQSGTGLGLAISAQYARLMGGQITMSSGVGGGGNGLPVRDSRPGGRRGVGHPCNARPPGGRAPAGFDDPPRADRGRPTRQQRLVERITDLGWL